VCLSVFTQTGTHIKYLEHVLLLRISFKILKMGFPDFPDSRPVERVESHIYIHINTNPGEEQGVKKKYY